MELPGVEQHVHGAGLGRGLHHERIDATEKLVPGLERRHDRERDVLLPHDRFGQVVLPIVHDVDGPAHRDVGEQAAGLLVTALLGRIDSAHAGLGAGVHGVRHVQWRDRHLACGDGVEQQGNVGAQLL